MNGRMRNRLLQAAPALVLCLLAGAQRYQLELGHILSMSYLFWDYFLVGVIASLLVVTLFSRRLRVAAALSAIIVCLNFAWPTIVDWQRNGGPASGPTLKVISYNWLGEERDRSDIYAWLKQEAPDIVAIQEIDVQEPGVTTALYEMFPYHTQAVGDVMILSRYPILKQANRMIDANAMIRAELNVDNRRLVVWAIHPSTLKELAEVKARDYYLSDLARYVAREGGPLLMMGDFNATRWEPGFRAISRAGNLHEQPSLLALPTRMAVRKGLSFFGSPIDHIITNGTNILSSCHTGPLHGSDHRPLICNLQLGN